MKRAADAYIPLVFAAASLEAAAVRCTQKIFGAISLIHYPQEHKQESGGGKVGNGGGN